MPTPPSAARAICDTAFAEMVRAGLCARPKELQPTYFYDALGSALFDAIMRLPEYTITRAETTLLRAHGREIIRAQVNFEVPAHSSPPAVVSRTYVQSWSVNR